MRRIAIRLLSRLSDACIAVAAQLEMARMRLEGERPSVVVPMREARIVTVELPRECTFVRGSEAVN